MHCVCSIDLGRVSGTFKFRVSKIDHKSKETVEVTGKFALRFLGQILPPWPLSSTINREPNSCIVISDPSEALHQILYQSGWNSSGDYVCKKLW